MLCDELLHPGDVFEKYPDVIKIYDIFSMATHPHYRQQGQATVYDFNNFVLTLSESYLYSML